MNKGPQPQESRSKPGVDTSFVHVRNPQELEEAHQAGLRRRIPFENGPRDQQRSQAPNPGRKDIGPGVPFPRTRIAVGVVFCGALIFSMVCEMLDYENPMLS